MQHRILSVWVAIVGWMVVFSSIHGTAVHYSPIPYWDQWDGYLGFYQRFTQHFGTIWEQHGEHRLVIPRLIFLADIRFFGGLNIFTLVMNYALLGAICLVLWRAHRRGAGYKLPDLYVWGLLTALMFSWIQVDNLTWGFQSQVMLVYLFALLAFRQFAKDGFWPRDVGLALLFCLLSELSMGNGMAAFFALAVQSFVMRRPLRVTVLAVAAGVLGMVIYFIGYNRVTVDIQPKAMGVMLAPVQFFLAFLGAPFYYLVQNPYIAELAGAFSLGIGAALTIHVYRTWTVTPYRSVLIALFAMIVASAIAAAKSRWMLGVSEAATSRYTTPVLLSYTVLILFAVDVAKSVRREIMVAGALIATALLPWQYRSIDGAYDPTNFKRNLAVLGTKIGLDHPDVVNDGTFPANVHDRYLGYVDYAIKTGFGPYGSGWLRTAGTIEYKSTPYFPGRCNVTLDETHADSVGNVSTGWIFTPQDAEDPTLIVLMDADKKIVGYGVSGMARPDVRKAHPGVPLDSGWIGYSKPGSKVVAAYGYIDDALCSDLPMS